MLRRSAKPGPIGLDIGSAGVKLLQLGERDGQPAVLAAAHAPLDVDSPDGTARGLAVRRAIEEALRKHPFRGRDVVCALGCGEFQMKSIRLPKMPAEELATAVEFEAQDRFDLGGRPAQLRYLTAGDVRHGNEIKEEVIVFAARDDIVQARLEMLESLRLRPSALDITPCALARSFVRFLRRTEDIHAVNVFVDVGWQATAIIINYGADVRFVKIVDVGGRHMTEAAAQTLNLSMRQALELRIRIMQDTAGRRAAERATISDEVSAAISDAARPILERLQKDLQLCLRYFAVTFRGRRPESVTFTGGEACEPSLVRILSESCDIPCMIGHPLRGLGTHGVVRELEARSYQPAWGVACGLALRGSPWVSALPTGAAEEPVTVSA